MPEFMTVVICETRTVYITGNQQDDGYCWTYRCMREDWLCMHGSGKLGLGWSSVSGTQGKKRTGAALLVQRTLGSWGILKIE